MTSQIVRTTRSIQVNNGIEEPVETVDERTVERVVRAGAETRSYSENPALQPWSGEPLRVTQRQRALLRRLTSRLSASEERNRVAANSASFERAWFWVLWGILMLIFGSALAVVLILILTAMIR